MNFISLPGHSYCMQLIERHKIFLLTNLKKKIQLMAWSTVSTGLHDSVWAFNNKASVIEE